jgi:hypothetical protein
LLDISPTLTEAAGAIVDVSFIQIPFFFISEKMCDATCFLNGKKGTLCKFWMR